MNQSAVRLVVHGSSLPDELLDLPDKEFDDRLLSFEADSDEDLVRRSRWVKIALALATMVGLLLLHLSILLPFLCWTQWLHPASAAHVNTERVQGVIDALFVAILSTVWTFGCHDVGSLRLGAMVGDVILSDLAEVTPAYVLAACIHSQIAGTR